LGVPAPALAAPRPPSAIARDGAPPAQALRAKKKTERQGSALREPNRNAVSVRGRGKPK